MFPEETVGLGVPLLIPLPSVVGRPTRGFGFGFGSQFRELWLACGKAIERFTERKSAEVLFRSEQLGGGWINWLHMFIAGGSVEQATGAITDVATAGPCRRFDSLPERVAASANPLA